MRLRIEGIAAPLPIDNLDTDQIMPKQFLRIIAKEGLGEGALYDLRFEPDGRPRPGFVLNRPEFKDSRILIGGPNFGCGSSREHAVWGLQQLGIEAVIAPSFGEIFFGNALNNRLLPVMLAPAQIAALLDDIAAGQRRLLIDVELATITSASHVFGFALGARYKKMLIEGLDMVGATLESIAQIEAFERCHFAAFPWADAMRRDA
jgi:3-isopropylmalate/(R)-2-methylmalate dehydratase small subunit